MIDEHGVDEIVRQWTAERSVDQEQRAAREIASAWLAESGTGVAVIPGQRSGSGAGAPGGVGGLFAVETADPAYLAAMRRYLPGVPEEVLAPAASCWQLVGSIGEAQQWWDAGVSPLDQRALDYRAAGLTPADLGKHLGPYTVLEHLRRGSAPAWCVARLQRQRRDGAA